VSCSVIVSANVARLKEAIESLLQPPPGGTGTCAIHRISIASPKLKKR
jgi:hypothetical protein